MYVNVVIFQKHCVNFEIKNEQIATPHIPDYVCVDLEGKISK
jgi:hypothetical protein